MVGAAMDQSGDFTKGLKEVEYICGDCGFLMRLKVKEWLLPLFCFRVFFPLSLNRRHV